MDSGTLALWLVGVLWVLFALWVWVSQKFMTNAHELHVALRERQDEQMQGHRVLIAGDASRTEWLRELEERVAGVEALLVSTVGQETEDFCRQMDAFFEKMDEAKPDAEPKEKLTLSEEFCGKFGKKGRREVSEFIRRGECLEAVAKVNSVLARFEERIRQIRKDIGKLEAENRALKDKVQILASWRELVGGVVAKHADRIQTLEIKNEGLSARTIGWQNDFGKSVRDQFRRIDERFVKLLAKEP